ncbi:MAG: hypothetical protein WBE68_04945, partial [Candidatus Nitrosopolaris sp.]
RPGALCWRRYILTIGHLLQNPGQTLHAMVYYTSSNRGHPKKTRGAEPLDDYERRRYAENREEGLMEFIEIRLHNS